MSEILRKARQKCVPQEFSTEKVSKILDLYVMWYEGDVPAAKVALIQDIIDLGAEEENGRWQQGIIEAIRVSNG